MILNAHKQQIHTSRHKNQQKCKSPHGPDQRQFKLSHSENCPVVVTERGKSQVSHLLHSTHNTTHMQVNILSTHVVKNPSGVSHTKISNRMQANSTCKQSYETKPTNRQRDKYTARLGAMSHRPAR